MGKKLVSLIIPCYNEEAVLPVFYEETCKVMDRLPEYDFELLFVDDGSGDRTLAVLKQLSDRDARVSYLAFSRNFGKEAAMYAGFCNVKGDYTAVLDADLQDPPSLLPQMLNYMEEEEYDSVATKRLSRKGEPPVRSFFAKMFYRIINRISDADIEDGARDFRLMKKSMVDAIVSMGEYNRFSKGIFGWIGFRTKWISYDNIERAAGNTKWSFWGLLKYSIDGIVNFSQVPLTLASWLGLSITMISVIMILVVIVRKLVFGDPVQGWASLACIIMFLGGIQLFCMGIIGQYLAKTYMESKKRPHYIISETNRKDAEKVK